MISKTTEYPIEWISVEVDTRCNIRCTMCPIAHDLVENQGRVTVDTIDKLCQLAVGWTDKISLAVMGEPLLHPDCPEMIRRIKKYNLSALVWTNGLLVNERRAQEILEAGLDKLIFSFEIIDKELHERVRVGASYDKVRQNLDNFIELKERISPSTEIAVWNVVPEKDYDLVVPDEIVKAYPDVGIFVSRAADWAGTLNIETMHGRGAPVVCNLANRYMSVSYKGDIVACCNDFNHQHVMGNIHDLDDLGEFWFGPQHQDLLRRQKCDDMAGIQPCEGCSARFSRDFERVYVQGDEVYEDKAAANAAKQVKGQHARS